MGPQMGKGIDKVPCPVFFSFKGVRLITHSHKFTLKCLRKEGWEMTNAIVRIPYVLKTWKQGL